MAKVFICSFFNASSSLPSNLLAGNLEAYLRVSSKLKLGIVGDAFSMRLNSSSIKSRERAETDATVAVTSGTKNPTRAPWVFGVQYNTSCINLDLCLYFTQPNSAVLLLTLEGRESDFVGRELVMRMSA